MKFNAKYFLPIVAFGVLFLAASGCVPKNYRQHPRLDERANDIDAYGFLIPEVEICELTAGGVREERDDWCELGQNNVVSAMSRILEEKGVGFELIRLSEDPELQRELDELRALYKAVSYSIRLHAYDGPNAFPLKKENFEYSIGPVEGILEKFECDAVLFIYGTDAISTAGRKALMALGVIAGAFTGVYVVPGGGVATLNIAVVGPSGDVLWYCSEAQRQADLRDPESSYQMVRKMLENFPR